MVSSLRPQEKSKKLEDNHHGNRPPVPPRPARHHRYSQAKVDRLKCVLVVINTLLFVIGAFSLGFSTYGLIQYKLLGYEETFQDVTIVTLAPWMAAISSTLAVVTVPFYGCYGAVAQRKCFLVLYFLFLLLMLLLDLVMCLWIVTTADKIQKGIQDAIRTAVKEYGTDTAKRRALDDLQNHLGCCGSDTGIRDFGFTGPPASCTYDYLLEGCNVKMLDLYHRYRFIAMGVFAGLAAILMITMIIVIMLLSAIQKKKPPERPPERTRPDITVVDASNLDPPERETDNNKLSPLKSRPDSQMSNGSHPARGGYSPEPPPRPGYSPAPRRPSQVPSVRISPEPPHGTVINIGNSNESSVV